MRWTRTLALLTAALLLWSPLTYGLPAQQEQAADETPKLELGLYEAVEMALRHNLQVKIASFSPDIQEESIVAARQRFDPTFTFNLPQQFNDSTTQGTNQLAGGAVVSSQTLSGGFSFAHTLNYGTNWDISWSTLRNVSSSSFSTFNPRIQSQLNLSVTQPLLRNFGRDVNEQQIIVAQNTFEASQEQFRQQVQGIILQVYQAYWELVFAESDLDVRQQSFELAEQQLARNKIQVEIGTLAPIETIQAEQQVANRGLQLLQAEVAVSDAEDDLKRLLNIEAARAGGWMVDIVPSTEPEVDDDPIDVEAAIRAALENDPTLRQRRIDMRSRELNVKVARNQLLPQVNFNGSVQLAGQGGDILVTSGGFGSSSLLEVQEGGFSDAVRNMMSGDFRNWSVGLSVTFPLNNWGAKAQHAQAVINQRSVSVQIADREQQVRVDVMKAARQVETGAQSVRQSTVARELAERQLDAEERKFAVGTTTNFQVLEFQRQLADAQSAELRSIINYVSALARLENAKGTLLESLGVHIDMAGVPTGQR